MIECSWTFSAAVSSEASSMAPRKLEALSEASSQHFIEAPASQLIPSIELSQASIESSPERTKKNEDENDFDENFF